MSLDRSYDMLLLLLIGFHCAFSATITEPPHDVTVLFGGTAVFDCTGEGDLLQWTYDGITVDEDQVTMGVSIVHHDVPSGMILSSSLHVTATIENDGVAVSCRIVTHSPYTSTNARAYLYVIRISPVRDLSLSIDDVPYVTWTIPSVIAPDISVSDIRYTVTLEGGNINTSPVNDIDDTYYQFTDITVLNCTVYSATITAYDVKNQMYSSDAAMAEDVIIDNTTLSVTDAVVHVLSDSDCYVNITIEVDNTCSLEEVVQIVGPSEEMKHDLYPVTPPASVTYVTKLIPVQRNDRYIAKAMIGTEVVGEITKIISTYHVQDFVISDVTNNGDIIITCIFAIGSTATGCLVIFTSSSDYEQQVANVYKVDDSTVSSTTTTVPDGTYDVTVYDVVGGSTVVVITTTVTITNVPVPTSTLPADTSAVHVTTVATTAVVDTTSLDITGTDSSSPSSGNVAIIVGTIAAPVLVVLVVIVITAVVCVRRSSHYRRQHDVTVRRELAALRNTQAEYNPYDGGKGTVSSRETSLEKDSSPTNPIKTLRKRIDYSKK